MPSITSTRQTELGALIQAYLEKFPSTQGSKRRHLEFLQRHDLGAVDASILRADDFATHIRIRRSEGISPATALNELIWISAVLEAAETQGILSNTSGIINEARAICCREDLVAPSIARFRNPTSEELGQLYEYFSHMRGRARIPMRDIIALAVCGDLRAAEICRIEWETMTSKSPAPALAEQSQAQIIWSQIKRNADALEIIRRQPRVDLRVFPFQAKSVGATFAMACKVLRIRDLRFDDLRRRRRPFEYSYQYS